MENQEQQAVEGKSVERIAIRILYGLGALIATTGIIILISDHWEEIGLFARVVLTLGMAAVAYTLGFILNRPHQSTISQVMFTIASILAPLGAVVLLGELDIDFGWRQQAVTALVSATAFGCAWLATRRNILVLLTVGFVSWGYFAMVIREFGDPEFMYTVVLPWANMALGAAYLAVARMHQLRAVGSHGPDGKEKRSVTGLLYAAGTLLFLQGGLWLDGYFDVIYPVLLAGMFFGSVFVKSRWVLVISALFLAAYLFQITAEYFAESIGWPLSLVILGFLIIAISYFTFSLNRKFILKKP